VTDPPKEAPAKEAVPSDAGSTEPAGDGAPTFESVGSTTGVQPIEPSEIPKSGR
jgi:hypothetical protein